MDRTKIYEQVTISIRGFLDEDIDITMESELQKLISDSLMFVEFVLNIEEAFEIDIPDEDVEKFMTVQDCVNYVEKKLEECGR